MSRSVPLANTEAEIEAFFQLSERLYGFDAKLSAFYIDGWLTAVALGPVRLPIEGWLERLFGDAFERAFADPPDRAQALATLHARFITLGDMLDAEAMLDQPDQLRLDPLFDTWSDEDRLRMREEGVDADTVAALHDGALWADGVLAGLSELVPLWQLHGEQAEIDEALDELVDQVEALTLAPGSPEWREFLLRNQAALAVIQEPGSGAPAQPSQPPSEASPEPSRDDLLANACFAVQDMRLFLLDHGPRPEPRRVASAPGRNDPCPCGSGKKFKKCHGAGAVEA